MSSKLYRLGDLVKYNTGYNNGVSIDVYAKLIGIKDIDGVPYDELLIVTGEGERNSKVKLDIKSLSYCKDLTPTSEVFKGIDPHKIYSHYDYWLEETDNKIDFLLRKKDFLLKNRNRIDKLNELV